MTLRFGHYTIGGPKSGQSLQNNNRKKELQRPSICCYHFLVNVDMSQLENRPDRSYRFSGQSKEVSQ